MVVPMMSEIRIQARRRAIELAQSSAKSFLQTLAARHHEELDISKEKAL